MKFPTKRAFEIFPSLRINGIGHFATNSSNGARISLVLFEAFHPYTSTWDESSTTRDTVINMRIIEQQQQHYKQLQALTHASIHTRLII